MSTEKKKEINHYIQKVEDHKKIINIETEAFDNVGKWLKYFWNNNDIVLEIWTGLGNFFSSEVAKNTDKNYIWFEIKFKRLFVCAEKTIEKWGENFVMVKTKWQNIDKTFSDWELSLTYVFFPDPWANKDRQRKHRLFSEKFISDLYQKTKLWWKLIFKTDHIEYFDSTLELFKEFWKCKINLKSYDYENETELFDKDNMTEFEHMFRLDKVKTNYVEFEK